MLLLVGLGLAYTRSALAGGLAGVLLVLLLGLASRRLTYGGAVFSLAVVVVVLGLGALSVLVAEDVPGARRLRAILDWETAGYDEERIAIWADALRIGTEPAHVLLGVGVHNYVFHSSVTATKVAPVIEALKSDTIKQAHNQYLTFLTEMGLVGLVLYLSMLVSAVRNALGSDRSVLWLSLVGAFAVMNLTGDFVMPRAPYLIQVSLTWWLLYGFLVLPPRRNAGVAVESPGG